VDPNPLTEVDRRLLKRCLNRDPGSWNDFVDRFLSLIYHVIGYTAHLRSVRLTPEDVEDIAAEVLLKIVASDFRVLREFRGEASLATYLTVVARRICIQELVRRQAKNPQLRAVLGIPEAGSPDDPAALKGMESLEEVEKLLRRLSGREREIVRLYYLEGRTYEEISTATEVPINTIGSVLSRARKKLRPTGKPTGSMDSFSLAAGMATPPTPSRPKAAPPPPENESRPVKPPKGPKSSKMPRPDPDHPKPE
jgi:RNA polymerase sigma-70 factor (ECF subfamily)